MKKLLKLLAAAVILGLFSVPVYAGVKIDGVIIDPGEGATSAATVYYQGSPPFSIYRSLDGTQWTTRAAASSENYYTDNGLDNYYNYYFKVTDSTGSYAITAAYPPNNNVHSSFRLNSSLCAACHVTHSASGGYLLVQPTSVALCTTCHDGTQSKYDVRNGKVRLDDTYADTSGGPFGPLASSGQPVEIVVYEAYSSLSTESVPILPTSIHNLGTAISNAPGGVSSRDRGLACIDCHDPHGNTSNFRNLKTVIEVTYDVSVNLDFQAYARTDPDLTGGYGEDIYYNTGSIYFCSACHSDYAQASGSGAIGATTTQIPGLTVSTQSMNKFMHAVNTPLIFRGEYYSSALPLESGTGVNVVVCLTCHQAHGTFKTGENKITGSTALLRLDRQGVCEECHKK